MRLKLDIKGHEMKYFCLFVVSTTLVSCTSTVQRDKEKVLNELLREGQVSQPRSPSPEATPSPVIAQGPGLESEADDESVADTDVGADGDQNPEVVEAQEAKVAIDSVNSEVAAQKPATREKISLPPALPRSTQLNLPLPRGSAHADVLHFLNAHASIMQAYKPYLSEWQLFSGLFSKNVQVGPDDFLQYRIRVRENPDRTHWLFVWGVYEASNALLSGKGATSLLVDRQQDFISRMRTLVYLMGELELAGMKADYRMFLRKFYKNMSAKYFRRILKDRPAKPPSLISPR